MEKASHVESIVTQFAPARRASLDDIRRQTHYFSSVLILHQLLDAMPNGVIILNQERQAVYVNNTFLKAFQLDEESVLGYRPGEILGCVHALESEGECGTTEFCRACGAVNAILISQRGTQSIEECRITQIQNKGGGSLDLRVWATPFELESEPFTISAIADIGDEKRRRALEHVFFHDILNIAGVLYGAIELMIDANASEIERIQKILRRSSDRLVNEIKAQQELLRAENNELAVQPRKINSLELLWQISDIYTNHEASQDRHIYIDPRAESIEIVSDPILLGRVIGNMIKNALEASRPGETVTLGCKVIEDNVQFWVHNPAYMPREVQLQVFQRSFSTKGKGRGLGTYSMRLLSERYLRGKVSFATSPEEGTTFKARYPLQLELSTLT